MGEEDDQGRAEAVGRSPGREGRPDGLDHRRARHAQALRGLRQPEHRRAARGGARGEEGGDLYDDGLTRLERNQMASGREGFLTGAAKLRYRRLTGQIQDADAEGLTDEIQNSVGM